MDRRHFRKSWVTLLLFFVAANGARAQWTKVAPNLCAPEEQYVGAIRFHDAVAWAGTNTLYYSKDTGKTWNPVPSFPHIQSSFGISDIAIFDSLHVLVSTIDVGGVYLTTDGGLSWNSILPSGLPLGVVQVAFNGSASVLHVLEGNSPDLSLLSSLDGGATWSEATTTNTAKAIALCFAIAPDHSIYVFSLPGAGGKGWINKSSDFGKTWNANSSKTDGDCNTLSIDSCDPNRLYLVNENTVLKTDNQSRIDMTTDAGTTWQTSSAQPLDYFNGSLSSTRRVIYVGAAPKEGTIATTGIGVDRSTDGGITWKNIGGPLESFDTRTIAAVNDNIVLVLDTGGSVWRTMNSGGSPVPNPLLASPSTLFQADTIFCDSLTRSVQFSRWGCSPPSVSSWSIIGADSASFVASNLSYDSILVTMYGIKEGEHHAQLVLLLDDGTSDTVALAGYVNSPNVLTFSLKPTNITAHSGDTLSIHIYLSGTANLGATSMLLPFGIDTNILVPIDFQPAIAGLTAGAITYSGGTETVLLQASSLTLNGETLIGTLHCRVYLTDTLSTSITLPTASVNLATAPCTALSLATDSVNVLVIGCGTKTLLQFMKSGTLSFEIQSITPNPASNEIDVLFRNDLRQPISYELIDALGNTRQRGITQGRNVSLDASSFPQGVYFFRASSENGIAVTRKVVIER